MPVISRVIWNSVHGPATAWRSASVSGTTKRWTVWPTVATAGQRQARRRSSLDEVRQRMLVGTSSASSTAAASSAQKPLRTPPSARSNLSRPSERTSLIRAMPSPPSLRRQYVYTPHMIHVKIAAASLAVHEERYGVGRGID